MTTLTCMLLYAYMCVDVCVSVSCISHKYAHSLTHIHLPMRTYAHTRTLALSTTYACGTGLLCVCVQPMGSTDEGSVLV
jgi:hypothetical protein